MKKKGLIKASVMAFAMILAGCGNNDSAPKQNETQTISKSNDSVVVYFTWPENGEDTSSSASIVIEDGEKLGSTQFVAQTIADQTKSEIIQIIPNEDYPLEHEELVDQASTERANGARPAITTQPIDWNEYDTIYLGYPIWWSDLPMPVYTFLEQNDLSGKTIRLFVTHGGSGSANTEEAIKTLEPDANVSDDLLILSRNEVPESKEKSINRINHPKE